MVFEGLRKKIVNFFGYLPKAEKEKLNAFLENHDHESALELLVENGFKGEKAVEKVAEGLVERKDFGTAGDFLESKGRSVRASRWWIEEGKLLEEMCKYEEAKKFYVKADSSYRIKQLDQKIANKLLEEGKYEEALIKYEDTCLSYSDVEKCKVGIANKLFDEGLYEAALDNYKRIYFRGKDKKIKKCKIGIAKQKEASGNYTSAAEDYENVDFKKSAARCYLKEAKKHFDAEDYENAADYLKNAIRLRFNLDYGFGILQFGTEEQKKEFHAGKIKGRRFLQKAILQDAKKSLSKLDYYRFATVLYANIDDKQMADKFWLKLGDFYSARKEYKKAEDCYDKGHDWEKSHECSSKHRALDFAKRYQDEGEFGLAIMYYEEYGDSAKVRECGMMSAEKNIRDGKYDEAAQFYALAGETEKAKECWLKSENRSWRAEKQIEYFIKGGLREEAAFKIIAEGFVTDENYKTAAEYYEKGKDKESANKCWLTLAEQTLKMQDEETAADYFTKAEKTERAREIWIKKAEEYTGEWHYEKSKKYYMNAGMTEEEARFKAASRIAEEEMKSEYSYSNAVKWYKEAGMPESEIYTKFGDIYAAEGEIELAIDLYSAANNKQRLFDMMKTGGIELMQKLASLVETEEDEIAFNEARAGWVL
jgi:tetratricopeptide (TPR) repeat protein